MSQREDYLAARVDRKRERESAKQTRTARRLYIRMRARQAVTALVAEFDVRAEKVSILRAVLDIVGEMLWPLTNRVDAATAFNAVAADVCAIYRLPKAVKNAAAEHAWSRLTAANDGGEE